MNAQKSYERPLKKSTSQPKRFSVAIRNTDFNAYRAYKLVNEPNAKNPNAESKTCFDLLNGKHNLTRFPFGLKEKRFRWQTNKNLGEKHELQGTMVKHEYSGHETGGANWEKLINRTSDINESRSNIFATKAGRAKYTENKNSARTVVPDLDASYDNTRSFRRSQETYNRSTANGSISNLLEKTPINEPTYKLHSNKLTQGSGIFTPDLTVKKPAIAKPVYGHLKASTNFADAINHKAKRQAPEVQQSYCLNQKLTGLSSDIFNMNNETSSKKALSRSMVLY